MVTTRAEKALSRASLPRKGFNPLSMRGGLQKFHLLGRMMMPKPLSAGIVRWHASRYVRFGKGLHDFARESRASVIGVMSLDFAIYAVIIIDTMDDWQEIPRYATCFVCGPENESGLHLSFEIKGDEVRTKWTPRPEHCGYSGIAHGGVISAVLDEIMGWTGWQRYEKYYLTAELGVRFKKPVFAGVEHDVRARLLKAGSRLYSAEGEIRMPDGEIAATATGRFIVWRGNGPPNGR